MPKSTTRARARADERAGKSPSTQAGEFVREEIHHVREKKHGARSTEQAIAIGLSKARRAGVDLPPPARGEVSEKTRRSAQRAYERGRGAPARNGKPSQRRRRAIREALEHESTATTSPDALSRQARSAARKRSAASRSRSARQGARTRARNARASSRSRATPESRASSRSRSRASRGGGRTRRSSGSAGRSARARSRSR